MVSLHQEIPNQPPSFLWDPITPIGNAGNLPINEGSFWHYINDNEDKFSIYKHLVITAQLERLFNSIQTSMTFFVPLDSSLLSKHPENIYLNMDKNQALSILNYNTLPRVIDSKTIKSSQKLKLETRIRGQKMCSKIRGNTIFLNINSVRVVNEDIIVNNGLVHWTDDFCIPEFNGY